MIDVLEHFTRPEALELAETIRTRALAPQGRLIIQVPNMQSPFATLNLYHDITHQWAYTEASLRQLLRSAGFRKVQCCPQNYPMTGTYIPRQLLRLASMRPCGCCCSSINRAADGFSPESHRDCRRLTLLWQVQNVTSLIAYVPSPACSFQGLN
jgi:hypothetical protein